MSAVTLIAETVAHLQNGLSDAQVSAFDGSEVAGSGVAVRLLGFGSSFNRITEANPRILEVNLALETTVSGTSYYQLQAAVVDLHERAVQLVENWTPDSAVLAYIVANGSPVELVTGDEPRATVSSTLQTSVEYNA